MGRREQQFGKTWELIIERIARSQGMNPIRAGLTAKYLAGGRVIVQKSDLDFRVLSRGGRCQFFDAKTFDGDSFAYSEILRAKGSTHQIDKAVMYEDWGFVAGFLVWFRKTDEIVFFRGSVIQGQSGRRFSSHDGQLLGSLTKFDLHIIK